MSDPFPPQEDALRPAPPSRPLRVKVPKALQKALPIALPTTLPFRKDILLDLLRLAWPAILEQILVMMGGIVVTIFLGRYGTDELAAAGLVNMIFAVLQTAFAGLATGATVVIARIRGEGDDRRARSALFQALLMALGLSVIVTAASLASATPLVNLFFGRENAAAAALADTYFRIMLASLPFFVVDLTISASMRGAGDTFTPMAVTGFGNVLNIVLCALLIGPLGITGAGIALASTRVATALVRIVLMFRFRRVLFLIRSERYRYEPALMGRILRQGLPAFIEQAVMQSGFLMMSAILATLGTAALASWQVGVNMNSLAFMPIFGLAVATTTYVGQALGAGRIDDAAAGVRGSLWMGIPIMTLLGGLAALFAEPLARLYSSDPTVIAAGIGLIRIFALLEPLLGVINLCSGTLRAAGDIKYVTATSFIGLWLFRVGISTVLVRLLGFGIYGVMVGTGIDFFVRATLYALRVRRGRWKHMKV